MHLKDDIIFYPVMIGGVAFGLYSYFFSDTSSGFYHNWGSLVIAGFFLFAGIGSLFEKEESNA